MVLFIFIFAKGQTHQIQIIDHRKQKTFSLKEGERIKLKTKGDKKLQGKLKIIDANTIMIDNTAVQLSSIQKLKRHPLAYTIAVSSVFAYTGLMFLGAAVLVSLFTLNPIALLFLIPATATVYPVIHPPNILKGYDSGERYSFKIVPSR